MVRASVPPLARPHVVKAEQALKRGDLPLSLTHVDAALNSAQFSDDDTRQLYGDLLKFSRRTKSRRRGAEELLAHCAVTPDAPLAHLAVSGHAHAGDAAGGVRLLAGLVSRGCAPSAGSFDVLIQSAGRKRDLGGAVAAYSLMRRSRVAPTAFTLNSLLAARARAAPLPSVISLLRRADGGAPRWPGAPPDAVSWNTALGAAARAGEHALVESLFDEQSARGLADTQAHNVAIRSTLALGNGTAARALLRRMESPDVVTYNTLLDGLARGGGEYGWVLSEMASKRVRPDGYTLCSLLRAQDSVSEALRVWAWGNKQGIRRDARAWHHLIEAHIRHGRPGRAEALLGLHRREIKSPLSVESHNLHLRALVAAGEPQRALDHFERMLSAEEGGGAAGGAVGSAEAEAGGRGGGSNWLDEAAPAPDRYSYTIALTAMRALAEQTAPSAYGSTVRGAGAARAKEAVARARKAVGLARRAREDGGVGEGGGGGLSGPMVHALITACADDVDTALAVWQQEVRPALSGGGGGGGGGAEGAAASAGMEIRGARWVAPRPEEEDEAAAAARRDVEAHVVRALMGVCGAARRADEALRVCVSLRKQGLTIDASTWGAFRNAREKVDASKGGGGPSRLLQRGYERLLELECVPERARDAGATLGKIERIRIRW